MRKILLLHTGGTLGMAPSGTPTSLAPGKFLDHLLEQVPELKQLAELAIEVPINQDSACMEPEHILALAARVRAARDEFDGFVIIHGTDTMAFTASVLGFLLADLGKPVVLTGSQRPLAFVRTDARSNLVNAVDLACRGIAEVGICFGTHWLRGVATDKLSVSQFEAFQSPNVPPSPRSAPRSACTPRRGSSPAECHQRLAPGWTWPPTPSRPIRGHPGTPHPAAPRPSSSRPTAPGICPWRDRTCEPSWRMPGRASSPWWSSPSVPTAVWISPPTSWAVRWRSSVPSPVVCIRAGPPWPSWGWSSARGVDWKRCGGRLGGVGPESPCQKEPGRKPECP